MCVVGATISCKYSQNASAGISHGRFRYMQNGRAGFGTTLPCGKLPHNRSPGVGSARKEHYSLPQLADCFCSIPTLGHESPLSSRRGCFSVIGRLVSRPLLTYSSVPPPAPRHPDPSIIKPPLVSGLWRILLLLLRQLYLL